jgi:GH25 family lysozyme M1 (1,4-beta-N-acetylmuramidase)
MRRLVLPLLVLMLLALPASAPAAVRGIDVSRFQEFIDWEEVGETKVRFAFIQASRGDGTDCLVSSGYCGEDNYYDRNVEEARAQRIKVGAYHRAFASGRTRKAAKKDARKEVKIFVNSVDEIPRGDLLPVLDVETPFTDLSDKRLRLWIKTWLERVEARLGARPMVYTNASSWSATADTQRFAKQGYRLWVANFGVDEPLVPAENWAGHGWSVWQFTSTGSVRGVEGNVDKNRLGVPLRLLDARRSTEPIPAP